MATEYPSDVRTTINYLVATDSALYAYTEQPPTSKPWTNVTLDPHEVIVHNVRCLENKFTLDINGFQFLKHSSVVTNFLNEHIIKKQYYPEIKQLLKEYTGTNRVIIIGHSVRHGQNGTEANQVDVKVSKPAYMAHVDRTFEDTMLAVYEYLGKEAERLLQGRVRLVTVWRPIGSPVYHDPLAVADWRTISVENDLIPFSMNSRLREDHIFAALYSEKHTWYYLEQQTPSEIVLIKNFDSITDNCARLCLHSAFKLESKSLSDGPQRRSIEVNALVFG